MSFDFCNSYIKDEWRRNQIIQLAQRLRFKTKHNPDDIVKTIILVLEKWLTDFFAQSEENIFEKLLDFTERLTTFLTDESTENESEDDENDNVFLKDDIDLVYIFDPKKYVDSTQTLQNEQINYNIVRVIALLSLLHILERQLEYFSQERKVPQVSIARAFPFIDEFKKIYYPAVEKLSPQKMLTLDLNFRKITIIFISIMGGIGIIYPFLRTFLLKNEIELLQQYLEYESRCDLLISRRFLTFPLNPSLGDSHPVDLSDSIFRYKNNVVSEFSDHKIFIGDIYRGLFAVCDNLKDAELLKLYKFFQNRLQNDSLIIGIERYLRATDHNFLSLTSLLPSRFLNFLLGANSDLPLLMVAFSIFLSWEFNSHKKEVVVYPGHEIYDEWMRIYYFMLAGNLLSFVFEAGCRSFNFLQNRLFSLYNSLIDSHAQQSNLKDLKESTKQLLESWKKSNLITEPETAAVNRSGGGRSALIQRRIAP
ncbi:hypothetical protein [Coxiella burnetii]|uniref:hypothetical protein n=1 Tax=Coxiella burnetii TaxID=777 RepID=UPI0000DAEAD8|nr:hypothetical protein [Coxiella burnetii]ABX78843.1 hypothetical protein COXBURSA331_A1345 [Coxiella burnetii RSA 331]POZ78293.1 hypothetical protein CbuRSA461_06495 [Coxiella burnetii]